MIADRRLRLAALAALAAGCRPSAGPTDHAELPHCDGWCEPCSAGYLAGIRVPSPQLFEVLDAHGHDVDPAALSCSICREAWSRGGFCDSCRMGFVGGQAYLSRLTYHVARAERGDSTAIRCAACRRNARDQGWCESCGVGRVGVLVFKSRDDFDPAVRAVRKLERALASLSRCETCAIAIFSDGGCRHCRIAYRDGEPARSSAR